MTKLTLIHTPSKRVLMFECSSFSRRNLAMSSQCMSIDCVQDTCNEKLYCRPPSSSSFLECNGDFYVQLLELKRRNEMRLKQLEHRFKRRYSDVSVDRYIYGDCNGSNSTSDESLEKSDHMIKEIKSTRRNEAKSRKRRTKSAPASDKKQKTIIEPFSMTVREEKKSKEKKLLLEMKLEHDLETKEEHEDEIFQRNFKASAVPKHVNKSLFRSMVLENPQRYGGDKVSKYLTSNEIQKSKSMSDLNHFHAKPFPTHIFTNYAYERMKEAEEYRKIRREIRQKALLNEASYPSRMKSELEAFKGKLRKNNSREPIKRVRMKAIRSHNVPDFDYLYSKFQKALELKKMTGKPITVIEPFSFDGKYPKMGTHSIPRSSQYKIPECKPPPVTIRPRLEDKSTNSTRLREIANRNRIESLEYESKQRRREKKQLTMKEKEFRSHPEWSSRFSSNIGTKEDIRIRKIQRMEDEKERMLAYKMELKKIYNRVNNRPPLFVRQCESGVSRVENFYNSALNREGLTEAEILQFLSGNQRSMSYDNIQDGDQANLTYSRCSMHSRSSYSDSASLKSFEENGMGPGDEEQDFCREHYAFCSLTNK
uniref:Uncharacterized protein n=2 Tax=Lepeophtheirus salmonis TaxID=72036 RepID=A0A0K2TFV0_LEPSM